MEMQLNAKGLRENATMWIPLYRLHCVHANNFHIHSRMDCCIKCEIGNMINSIISLHHPENETVTNGQYRISQSHLRHCCPFKVKSFLYEELTFTFSHLAYYTQRIITISHSTIICLVMAVSIKSQSVNQLVHHFRPYINIYTVQFP